MRVLRKVLAFTALVAGVLYLRFLCALFYSQASIIYTGTRNRVDPAPPQSPGVQVLKISTSAGNTEAILLPVLQPTFPSLDIQAL